jgi:hypothetical protein
LNSPEEPNQHGVNSQKVVSKERDLKTS